MFTLLHYKGAGTVVVVAVVVGIFSLFFKTSCKNTGDCKYGNGAPNHMQEWQIVDRLLPPSQSQNSLKFMITINTYSFAKFFSHFTIKRSFGWSNETHNSWRSMSNWVLVLKIVQNGFGIVLFLSFSRTCPFIFSVSAHRTSANLIVHMIRLW